MNPSTEPQPSQPMPGQPTVAAPQVGDAPMPASQLSSALTTPTQPVAALQNAPQAAQDSDLIEKEWVTKAKEIVQTTKSDPFEQNRQLAALKADYMKKRYGKEVKVAE
jgi:Txe/YoeB family toxin of Txe-Axe toxin-antitoxin module